MAQINNILQAIDRTPLIKLNNITKNMGTLFCFVIALIFIFGKEIKKI